jgi:hypothetical protein
MPSIGSYSATQWIGPLGGAVTPLGGVIGFRLMYLASSFVRLRGMFAPSGYEGGVAIEAKTQIVATVIIDFPILSIRIFHVNQTKKEYDSIRYLVALYLSNA